MKIEKTKLLYLKDRYENIKIVTWNISDYFPPVYDLPLFSKPPSVHAEEIDSLSIQDNIIRYQFVARLSTTEAIYFESTEKRK